jgi:hypothetical protein
LCVKGFKTIKKRLTKDEAIDAVRAGEDVLAVNRRTAKEIAERAGGGRRPVHDPAHGPGQEGFRPHYHPHGRQGGHVFYSIASGLTLQYYLEDYGSVGSTIGFLGDLVNPLSLPKDIFDMFSDDECEDEASSCP